MSPSSSPQLANAIQSRPKASREEQMKAQAAVTGETTQPFTTDDVWYYHYQTTRSAEATCSTDIERKEADAEETAAADFTQPYTDTDNVWHPSDSCQSTIPNSPYAVIDKEGKDKTAFTAAEFTPPFATSETWPPSDSRQNIATNEWSPEDRVVIEKREVEKRRSKRSEVEKEKIKKGGFRKNDPARRETECEEGETPEEAPTVEEITNNLLDASYSIPDARLVISSKYFPESTSTDPAVVHLTPIVEGKPRLGIIQGIHDVSFAIALSFKTPYWQSPIELLYRIIYDPTSDSCLMVNEKERDERKPMIFLTSLNSPSNKTSISKEGARKRIEPGMWRISFAGTKSNPDKHHLVDFLLLKRQFSVLIYRAPPTKRTAKHDEPPRKRQRINNDGADIVASQNTPPGEPNAIVPRCHLASEYLREVNDKDALPILDVMDRETVVIQATTPVAAGYHIRRVKYIGHTKNTSVFICQHSEVPGEEVVVKVPQYSSKTDGCVLRNVANTWDREKTILEKLKHRNIMSLKAFDGRIFSLYLELLPSSLFTGLKSTWRLSDAHKILCDISSALEYLADQRIVHNDIKPFNITYSYGRGAVLIDFGMASSVGGKPLGGTPWYLPPDVLENGERGLPGDVWALGITMLYVLGKIRLPEKDFQGWMLKDLSKTKTNGKRMMEWLGIVASKRATQLGQKNKFERVVFKMLEPKGSLRVTAADVVSELGVLDFNVHPAAASTETVRGKHRQKRRRT